MDLCPSEIWSEIYSFACIDDGTTGRSLSLVSRYIHETSRPYKYQSVAVIGPLQLLAFADMIEIVPAEFRHVRCIFISAHSRHLNSSPRALSPEYTQRKAAYAALKRILFAISDWVRIVHTFFVFYRPFVLLPVELPILEELTVHGPLETSTDHGLDIKFNSLKRLHLTSSCSPVYLMYRVLKLAPSLTDLCISASDRSGAVADQWSSMTENAGLKLPEHLVNVYIHTPNRPRDDFVQLLSLHGGIMDALKKLEQADNRIILRDPLRLDLFSMIPIQEAIDMWTLSITGTPWWLHESQQIVGKKSAV